MTISSSRVAAVDQTSTGAITGAEAVKHGAERLRAAGVAEPQRDARLLLRWATGLEAAAMTGREGEPLEAAARARFERAIAERAERRPLSHIVGGRWFYGRWFKIDGRALDPRPETEALVEAGLGVVKEVAAPRVLDLGVGSGALLLSVLAERPEASGIGVDSSSEALELATENAETLGLRERAAFRAGDWSEGIDETFDLVLCNPPYIAADLVAELEPEVRGYEPYGALTPGADALAAYRRLAARELGRVVKPSGAAVIEFGRGQGAAVKALFEAHEWEIVGFNDLGGVERGLLARKNVDRT